MPPGNGKYETFRLCGATRERPGEALDHYCYSDEDHITLDLPHVCSCGFEWPLEDVDQDEGFEE